MFRPDARYQFVMRSEVRTGVRQSAVQQSAACALLTLFCVVFLLIGCFENASSVGAVDRQMGVNTFVLDSSCSSNGPTIDWASLANNQVAAIRELGANSIGIEFPVYMSSPTGSRVFARCAGSPFPQNSPSPKELGVIIDIAHAANLNVFVRPLLAQHNLIPKWRGNIEPKHKGKWFRTYAQTLLPYAEMATEHHVEHFAVATELSSLNGNAHWSWVVSALRHSYPNGDLVMTYLASAFGPEVPGTSYGADPYISLKSGDVRVGNHSNWRELQRAFLHLMPRSPLPLAGMVWDEVGIAASRGALRAPWKYDFPSVKFDASIQAKWFEMVCNIFRKKSLSGVYFQGAVLNQDAGRFPVSDEPNYPAQIQPESQAVIRKCFTGEPMEG